MDKKRTEPAWPKAGAKKPDTRKSFVVEVTGTFSASRYIKAEPGEEEMIARKDISELEDALQDVAGFSLATEIKSVEVEPDTHT
jgi:hypothetical protein